MKNLINLLLVISILLFTSCETEIIDRLPVNILDTITEYIPSQINDDSVYSSITLNKTHWRIEGGNSKIVGYENKIFIFNGLWPEINIYTVQTFEHTYYSYEDFYLTNYDAVLVSAQEIVLFAGGYEGIGRKENTFWPSYERHSKRVSIYNMKTNTWKYQQLSKIRCDFSAASLGNLVFFAGGRDTGTYYPSGLIDIYNTTTNKWTTQQLSLPRSNAAAVSVGNKVLFAGGLNNTGIYKSGITDRIDIYDAKENKWSTDDLSSRRYNIITAVIGEKAYFIGGTDDSGHSNIIDIYNAETNKWEIAYMDSPKLYSISFSTGNLIFFQVAYSMSKSIDYYNTITNSWSVIDFSNIMTGKYEYPGLLFAFGNKLFIHDNWNTLYEYKLE